MHNLVVVAMGVLVRQGPCGAEILIARRSAKTVLGGLWEFPGGKREAGETLVQCLQREFLEELGLAICVGTALPVVEHDYAHGRVRLNAFFCTLAGLGEAQVVAEHRWIVSADLATLPMPPANAPLIGVITDHLGR